MNDYDLRELSRKVISQYCQSWGQSAEERIAVLNEAVKAAGIDAVWIQSVENGEPVYGWSGVSKEECERAVNFRKELEEGWFKGDFHAEAKFIAELITKYKNGGCYNGR